MSEHEYYQPDDGGIWMLLWFGFMLALIVGAILTSPINPDDAAIQQCIYEQKDHWNSETRECEVRS